jgi:hypothetical protein
MARWPGWMGRAAEMAEIGLETSFYASTNENDILSNVPNLIPTAQTRNHVCMLV